ncbi:MAG: non-homologous end-joining DNA ligase [Longimicrobiales bacterium]|nr:non-homologous end-joining DNA ligase [Longimicrobiales bacterium]
MVVRGVEVSDPDKVFFPESGVTKGDVAEYYGRIAETMLPHVRGRCVSMHRWPDGIEGEDFYQKEAPDYFPDWIRTETVPRKRGGSVRHVVIDDARTLVYLADQACLTPHVWLSRAEAPAEPDRLVFDLDPPQGDDGHGEDVRWAARRLNDLLRELGLDPSVMTSGSRGFHIHVALIDVADFEVSRSFARDVSHLLAERHPERLTVAQRKQKRGSRIFLDYLRNGYAQTSVPPYSVRARSGAPVAMPIDWDELSGVEPRSYDVRNVFRRMGQKTDSWEQLDETGRGLDEAREGLDELAAEEEG